MLMVRPVPFAPRLGGPGEANSTRAFEKLLLLFLGCLLGLLRCLLLRFLSHNILLGFNG
jgi:hypothetical protein